MDTHRRTADRPTEKYALVNTPWLQPLRSAPEFQEIATTIKGDLDDVREDMIGVYQLMCK